MKRLIPICLCSLLLLTPSIRAQNPPVQAEQEEPASGGAARPSPAPAETLRQKWMREIEKWEDARTVSEAETTGPISEMNRNVIIRGVVNGSVSTLHGNIAILGTVNGHVSAVSGDVIVLGRVNGAVSTVSGDVRADGAVTGHVSVVSGRIVSGPNAKLTGGSASVGNRMSVKWKGGGADFSTGSQLFHSLFLSSLGALWRCGLLGLWICVGLVAAALFEPSIRRATNALYAAPALSAVIGLVWSVLFWVLLVCSAVLCLILIGIPLLMILTVFDMALHAFGLTVTFHVVGVWALRRANRPSESIFLNIFAGVCLLGLIRLVPLAGEAVWWTAGLFGVGATLVSRFGSSRTPPAAALAPSAA